MHAIGPHSKFGAFGSERFDIVGSIWVGLIATRRHLFAPNHALQNGAAIAFAQLRDAVTLVAGFELLIERIVGRVLEFWGTHRRVFWRGSHIRRLAPSAGAGVLPTELERGTGVHDERVVAAMTFRAVLFQLVAARHLLRAQAR